MKAYINTDTGILLIGNVINEEFNSFLGYNILTVLTTANTIAKIRDPRVLECNVWSVEY